MNNHEVEKAIIEAEEALAAVHLTLDLDTIERLLHADYVIVQPNGRIEGKAETPASLRADTRR